MSHTQTVRHIDGRGGPLYIRIYILMLLNEKFISELTLTKLFVIHSILFNVLIAL